MKPMKLSKLLLAWLYTHGHEISSYQPNVGITSVHRGKIYKFDLCGQYGGYRVKYTNRILAFYENGKLIKQTDLNQFTNEEEI